MLSRCQVATVFLCSTILCGCNPEAGTPSTGTGGVKDGTGGSASGGMGPGIGSGGSPAGSTGGSTGANSGGQIGSTGTGGTPRGTGGANSIGTGGVSMSGGSNGSGGGSGGSGSASGGSTGGTGSGGAVGVSPPGFFAEGYVQSNPWMGYLFTFADTVGTGSTISPICTTAGCTPTWGAQACVKGNVAKDASSATFVGLAFHVINPKVGAIGTWPVAGTGLLVTVSNPPPGARVQLQEMPAPTNDQRYCAPLPASGSGVIPFSSFKTYCWGDPAHPSVTLAPGTRIHEAAITVPGNAMAAVPVDFCLLNILPQ